MTNSPLLSIGMIVKNESRCLEKCLKALEPIRNAIPCELVIADTGSTDNTKEIAQKFADLVFDFTWVNDFSKARNAVIERCRGKWCLTIDADEYFAGNVEDLISLVKDSKYDKYDFVNIVIRNFTDPEMKSSYSDFFVSRIFRLGKGYKYQKAIHEFIPINDTTKSIILSSIIFNHDGYAVVDNNHLKIKTKRNLELLEKEYNNNPDNTRVILEILDSVYLLKQESIRYSKIAIEHLKGLQKDSEARNIFGPVISRKCIQYATKNNLPETKEWITFVFENFSDSYFVALDTSYICAEYFYKNNDYEATLKYSDNYLEALKKYDALDKNNLPRELFASSLLTTHIFHKDKIELLLSDSLFHSENTSSAVSHLKSIDIIHSDAENFEKWFSIVESNLNSVEIKSFAQNTLVSLFNLKDSGTEAELSQYNYAVLHISKALSKNCTYETADLFAVLPGALGISARLLNTTDKETATKILSELADAENFAPVAFSKLLELNIPISEAFLNLSKKGADQLLSSLNLSETKTAKNVLNITSLDEISSFNQCSFAFNLIANSWFLNANLSVENFKEFQNRFYEISRLFLTNLYCSEILECDDVFCTLPALHRFAIYYVMATDAEMSEDKKFFFSKAIEAEPKMKKLVDFSIEQIK